MEGRGEGSGEDQGSSGSAEILERLQSQEGVFLCTHSTIREKRRTSLLLIEGSLGSKLGYVK